MSKNSFVLYDDEYDYIKLLSFEERGKLLTAIYEYRLFGETNTKLSESGLMLFQFVKNHIDRDTQKYNEICEKRRVYGAMSTSKHKQVDASISKHKQASEADNDNVNDNDSDNDTDNDTELPKGNREEIHKEEKRKRFLPPSLDEVREYCYERQNNVNASQFVDFYTANGWKVGKNSMKDWKAAVRTWERNGIKSTVGRERTEAEKAKDDEFIRRQFERFEEIGNGL